MLCNAVFQGGGVRGTGHVGALEVFEKNGYTFDKVAGSSAGAIVAGLIASGYSANEIKTELDKVDYKKFLDCKSDTLCGIEKTIRLFAKLGLHNGDYFEQWYAELLSRKGIYTFGDLKDGKLLCGGGVDGEMHTSNCPLSVVASDISAERLLVFPRDAELFGVAPQNFSISKAVRMSMSIPFYFVPISLVDKYGVKHKIVDGGLLSNYPIWVLDDGDKNPKIPTFGFKFVSRVQTIDDHVVKEIGLLDYAKSITETMLNSFDNTHISESKGDRQRSILISCDIMENGKQKSIKSTDFDITLKQREALYNNGIQAAENFLQSWDFESWKTTHRY